MDTLINSEKFVKDRPSHFKNHNGVYNGFIIVKPRNKFLLYSIINIVKNVETKFYGHNALYPTGPGLLSEIIPINFKYELMYDKVDEKFDAIMLDNVPILISYDSYRSEQKIITLTTYDIEWKKRNIYK